MTPEIQRGRQLIEPVQHRGAGGGEPGHGLEERAGEAQVRQRQQQRQRRGAGQEQPPEREQQESVARLQPPPEAQRRARQHQAATGGERRGQQEFRPQTVAHEQRTADRQGVGEREGRQQQPQNVRDRKHRLGFLTGRTQEQAVLAVAQDRKSTRLNSSHVEISYAVFCLKKKKKKYNTVNV